MRIVDFESNKHLNDVALFLTQDEAEELCEYLTRMTGRHGVNRVHLSEIHGSHLEREVTVVLNQPSHAIAQPA